MNNRQFSISIQVDDEYNWYGAPTKKSKRKGAQLNNESNVCKKLTKHILTEQERCVYCFENPNRPKHLVVAIANFTYLMLPQYQPVAPGHCCIMTLQAKFTLLPCRPCYCDLKGVSMYGIPII